MTRNVLVLNNNEEILIIGNNKNKVLIKNDNNILKISNSGDIGNNNIYVKDLSMEEMTGFVLTTLLEVNDIPYNREDSNQEFINKILDNYYNLICGKNYPKKDISNIKFQAITYYN